MLWTYNTKNIDRQLDGKSSTTVRRLSGLTMPHGDSTCVDTITKASDNTSDNELRNTERGSL